MALIKCPQCNTAKTISGLGGMKKDCPSCKAIGYIEKPVAQVIVEANQAIVKQGFKSNRTNNRAKRVA